MTYTIQDKNKYTILTLDIYKCNKITAKCYVNVVNYSYHLLNYKDDYQQLETFIKGTEYFISIKNRIKASKSTNKEIISSIKKSILDYCEMFNLNIKEG